MRLFAPFFPIKKVRGSQELLLEHELSIRMLFPIQGFFGQNLLIALRFMVLTTQDEIAGCSLFYVVQ